MHDLGYVEGRNILVEYGWAYSLAGSCSSFRRFRAILLPIATHHPIWEGFVAGGPGMRASHFAEIAVAIATLIATHLLFDGEQQLAALPAGQLRNEEAALVGKSDRLAVKEDEAVEEQDSAQNLCDWKSTTDPLMVI